MFRDTRRKKLRNQVILAALAVSLMTFGIWLNYKTVVDQDGSEEAARKVKVESSQADQNSEERGDTSAKQPCCGYGGRRGVLLYQGSGWCSKGFCLSGGRKEVISDHIYPV